MAQHRRSMFTCEDSSECCSECALAAPSAHGGAGVKTKSLAERHLIAGVSLQLRSQELL